MLKRVLLLAAVAVASATGSARADFVIDDFTTPSPAQLYALGGPVNSTAVIPTSLPGISRVITVTQTANTFGTIGATSGLVGTTGVGGRFVLSTSAGATANASLLYTYAATQNLSAAGTAVQFTFASADLNTPFSVRITDSASATAVQTGTVSSSSVGTISLPITGFAINLASVRSIELLLNRNAITNASVAEADITLSDVRITTPNAPPAVPAPAGVVLLLAAAPALGLARRFARKA